MRFLHVNFKIFSKISNPNWFFAQTRKNLSLAFLVSFILIKAFQNSIKIALIMIKISFFKSKFAKVSRKVSKFFSFPLIFGLLFNIFASFRGLRPPPEPPTSPYLESFLNFSLNFLRKFRYNLQKIAKFP